MCDWSDIEIEAAAISHAEKVAALPVGDQPGSVGRWLRLVIDAGLKGPALAKYQRLFTKRVYEDRQAKRTDLSQPKRS